MVLSQIREFAYDDLTLGIRRVMHPNGSFPNSGSMARGNLFEVKNSQTWRRVWVMAVGYAKQSLLP